MLDVLFCSCVPDAVKLVQLHYWPGTPQQPSTAFSFELLDWIEALFLECQVALQDVSAAFQFLMEDKVMNKVNGYVWYTMYLWMVVNSNCEYIIMNTL